MHVVLGEAAVTVTIRPFFPLGHDLPPPLLLFNSSFLLHGSACPTITRSSSTTRMTLLQMVPVPLLSVLATTATKRRRIFLVFTLLASGESRVYVSPFHFSQLYRDFLLKPELLRAISDLGFEHPSEGLVSLVMISVHIFKPLNLVQQECIPQAVLGMDVLCQAKSGHGKTAVFVLATLQQLEPVNGEVSVLVLCHTRELAFQIKNEYARFAKYLPDVRVATFYGGTPVAKDAELLRDKSKCPHIVVATPGRLNALTRDKVLDAKNVKHFVLDECDKMLEQLG